MKLSDNFTFDLGWGNTHEDWGGVFLPENVIQRKDCIEIKTIKENVVGWRYKDDNIITLTKEYSTGHLVSKEQFLYGEFSAEITIPQFRGAWAAFWLYPMRDDGLHQTQYDEIDWFEQFRKDNFISKHRLQGNVHKNGTTDANSVYFLKTVRDIKIEGVWDEDEVLMYVNGRLFHQIYGYKKVSHRPMNILIGMGLGNWGIKLNPVENDNSMYIKSLKVNGVSLI